MRLPAARLLIALALLLFAAASGFAQVSLTTLGTLYTQNFDTLATAGTANNLTIPGWALTETGGGARDNEQYGADTGGSNTGDTYSYGVAGTNLVTERALGGLASGSLQSTFGASFTNNTGATITSLDLSYFVEQWRRGGRTAPNPATDVLNFQYSTNATSLITGAWTDVDALDAVTIQTGTTAATLDGNAPANRVQLMQSIGSLNIPNGATFWIRWVDPNIGGNDDGLAVDDFGITPQGAPPLPILTINDVTLDEGDADTTNFVFTVSLNAASGSNVTFTVATADGAVDPANAGTDYVAIPAGTPGTITAGNTSTTVTVQVNGEVAIEPDETFFVNLSNVTNATPGDVQGLGTINDDDTPLPTLTIDDVTALESNGATQFTFTVSLSAPAPGNVTFDIATADGTATVPGFDYMGKSQNAQQITTGNSTFQFVVDVNGDATPEGHETFFVNVTNVNGAVVGDGQGLGTITNDDINLNINNVSLTEGNSGTKTFAFTVTATGAIGPTPVTFDIATADTIATAPSDYLANSVNGASIAAPNSTYTFNVTINGDTTYEGNEQFFVNITNVSGANLVDGQGLGDILDDDGSLLSIGDAVIVEGNAGTQNLVFTVTANPAAPTTFTVDYTTMNDSAVEPGDYTLTNGQLTFNPGDTSKTISVPIVGDLAPEGNEQFFVNLSNATAGGTIADNQALGIIRMDDPFGLMAVDMPLGTNFDQLAQVTAATTPLGWTFSETGTSADSTYGAGTGSSGTGNTYSFGGAGSPDRAFGALQSGANIPTLGAFFINDTGVTVNRLTITFTGEQWRVGNSGTARDDRLDFAYSFDATNLTNGTWTDVNLLDFVNLIKTGTVGAIDGNNPANRQTISHTITGLNIPTNGTFWIRWSDFNAFGADDGLAIDDFSITANISGGLTIDDVSIIEGNSGSQLLTFTVTRTDPAPVGGTSVNYTTADNTATTADGDYDLASGTVTILQGETTATIDVTIHGDTDQETTENFVVNLSNPVNGILLDTQGVGTIDADDFTFTAINAIQGGGNQSPLDGQTHTVRGVVTGIKQGGSGGFFVQTGPGDPLDDSDTSTSEGIFVFTAGVVPPGVVIGNLVAVTGTVAEFPAASIPHTVTELSGTISVSVLANAVPLPSATTLTAADGAPSTNLSQYERFEGMRVAATLEVSAPTGGTVDEVNATSSSNGVFYGVIQGVARPRREPGIPVMDPIPAEAPSPGDIPRFDLNPERIRVPSTSQPGATQLNVAVGQTVSNLVGPLDYGFFEYSLLPEAATVPSVSGPSTAAPIPTPLSTELTVAAFNMFHLYDTVDEPPPTSDVQLSPAVYNNRLAKASLGVRNVLLNPDVLGVVEAENIGVLNDLAAKINTDNGGATNYVAYLVEGNDIGGIDVGYLVNANRVSVTSVTQEGDAATFINPNTLAPETLHDRPPLMLIGSIQRPDATTYDFTVLLVHLRSLNDAEEDSAAGRRARAKRAAGAEWVANFVQNRQTADPGERIVIVGDFNAFEFNDGFVDVIGTIKGTPAPANEVVLATSDLVNPDLTNLVDTIPAPERYSYVFDGNLQVLDHAIVNQPALSTVTRAAFGHLDAGFPEIFRGDFSRPERLSDHDAVVAYFDLASVGALEFSAANYDIGESTTTFNVTVNRTGGSAGAVSVNYAIAAGTATAGADFTAATGTLNFAAGDTSETFAVTISNDLIDEPDQTIALSLNTPTGDATLGTQSTATITIQDDDAAPALTIGDLSVAEGNSGSANANLAVTLTIASEFTVTVDYATANDTATAGSDYTAASGTLTFNPGVTAQQVPVSVSGDVAYENNEALFVNLTNPINASISDAQAVLTINNDDAAPVITIDDLTVIEGDSGIQQVSLTVTLTGATELAATLDWTLTAGTASCCGVDFSGPHGSMTFPVGTTTQTISAAIFGETMYENDETAIVTLTASTNATIGDDTGIFTIANDDAPPVFTISDISVAEGDAGTSIATVTVTRNGATAFDATVDFATADDTATVAGSDYSATSGTLTFTAAGPSTQQVNVSIIGDTVDEPNERVFVNLTNATTATIGDAQGEITIADDDGQPTLLINDISIVEGNAGSSIATLTVTLAGSTAQTVTVDYATADGTATAGSDYTATSGTLTFAVGTTTQQIDVTISGDAPYELDETVLVNLTNAVNGSIGDAQGVITITNDDAAPSFTISDISIVEGNAGTSNVTVTVTLTGSTDVTAMVDYATANDTATAGDYTATGGTLTFAPGTITQTFDVAIAGETVYELDETLFANLTNAVNAAVNDAQAVITITNDDAAPSLAISDISPVEGNAGTSNATVTVTLTGSSEVTATVDYATANDTAAAGSDYTATSGTLTFAPGVTTQTFDVAIAGDTTNEPNETFFGNLTNASNAAISDAQAVVTIVNDDGAPTLLIGDAAVTEGNAGTVVATFTVTLAGSTAQTVTVDYATASDTAAAPGDYAAASGTLTFAPGVTTQSVTVSVAGDTIDEANETFFVNLSNVANATISDAQALGTITDDDAAPTITIDNQSTIEGNAGTTNATFTLTLTGATEQTVTVDYALANGTATLVTDYLGTSGTSTFPPGTTTLNVTVAIVGDVLDEIDETYFVNLSNATNAVILDNQGQGTIIDDDGAPVLIIGDTSVVEGNAGTTTATFTVMLVGSTDQTVTVDYATANDSAVAPGDYAAASGTLTFAPGVLTQTIDVAVVGETAIEADETFFVNLTNATNATTSDSQAIGTITDDDGIGIADLAVTTQTNPDPPNGGQNFTFTITIQNNGPADATDVVLTDELGPGLHLASAIASQGGCTGNPTVTCNLGAIPVGGSATVTLTLIANAHGGTFANQITVDSAETDPTPFVSTAPIIVIQQAGASIPTLSEWMLIALAMALAAFAALRLRA